LELQWLTRSTLRKWVGFSHSSFARAVVDAPEDGDKDG
jgi:hypothetical protein